MDVPGYGKGTIWLHLVWELLLAELFVELVGVGHNRLNLLRVFPHKVDFIFKACFHQKQSLITPFMLILFQKGPVLPFSHQKHAGKHGPDRGNHCQINNNMLVEGSKLQILLHLCLDEIRSEIRQENSPQKLLSGRGPPVPDAELENRSIA